jgi:hypothetical protein
VKPPIFVDKVLEKKLPAQIHANAPEDFRDTDEIILKAGDHMNRMRTKNAFK